MFSFLEKTAKDITPVIKNILSKYSGDKTKETVYYQMESGGKRLRPALAIASCLVCGGKKKDVIYPAAGLEILHNNTLIIDDIIDHSLLRRNKPTVWANFGKSIAECLSLAYSVSFIQAVLKSKEFLKISEIFVKTMKTIVEGEILDILFEQYGRKDEPYIIKNRYSKITERDYFKMAGKKTAILFQSCCEVGGICAKAKENQVTALKNYGFNLGIAFQIKDDILDIFGGKGVGKKIGGDIKERKLGNIVILLAFRELPLKEKKIILNKLRKDNLTDKDIKTVIQLIKKTNSYSKACQLMERYIKKAKTNLKMLPKNEWQGVLKEIADFVAAREK